MRDDFAIVHCSTGKDESGNSNSKTLLQEKSVMVVMIIKLWFKKRKVVLHRLVAMIIADI